MPNISNEPTFNWEKSLDATVERVNVYLRIYLPHSQAFQDLFYEALSILIHDVEQEMRQAYRERDNAAAEESAREQMKLIGHILSGAVTFHHKEKDKT